MSGADQIFTAMRESNLSREGQAHLQQANFEATIVKKLLRAAKIELNVKAAVRESWEGFQATNISLAWFNQNWPRFPVQLGTHKLRFTSGSNIGWTDLFGSHFMKLPWMEAYMKLVSQMNWDVHTSRIGLCFNVPHAPGAAIMVLHNQPIQADNANLVVDPERREETETRIIRPFGNPRVTYVLESLTSFMTTVGTDWAM
jgi:hypothetical protein